jgi:hypothetical protein
LDASARSTLYQNIGHGYDPQRDSSFLDFFMILGPHASHPVLLFECPAHKFPYSPEAFQRILLFCYPTGLTPLPDQPIQSQFVFGMNDANSLIFGICSHVRLKGSSVGFLGPLSPSGVYCLCSVTSVPMLAAHFRYHEFLVDHLLGNCHEAPIGNGAAADGQSSDPQDFSQFDPSLFVHPEDPAFVAVNPNAIPVQFRLSVEFYYRIEVGANPQRHQLNDRWELVVPRRDDAVRELACYGLDVLFSTVGLKNVVRVLRSVLLEQKLVFVGSDIGIVTLCALTVLPLALPMSYKCALLPYLPDDDTFLAFLDSPVPFCFGCLNSELFARMPLAPDVTVVNLDDHRVLYPHDIPHLPRASELRAQLGEVIGGMNVFVPKRARDTAAFWQARDVFGMKRRLNLKCCFTRENTYRVLDVINGYVNHFLTEDKICGCRVRDTTDQENLRVGFVKEVYMLDVSPTETDFFDQFLQTQTFAAYFEKAAI